MNWGQIFGPDTAPLEMVVRGSIVYLVIFTLLRVVFRREAGTTGMTDLLVLVLLADAAQNGMAGNYNSVSDGLILVGTLVFWAAVINMVQYRFPGLHLKPDPMLMVKNGRLLHQNMRRELLTQDELLAQLRQRGARRLDDVETAIMEPDGQFSVVLRQERGDAQTDPPPRRGI